MQYTTDNLIIHPGDHEDPGVIVEVTPEQAGWDFVHFQARIMAKSLRLSVEGPYLRIRE